MRIRDWSSDVGSSDLIERPYLDRRWSYIHEATDQPGMLKAVSKAYFRIWSPETALGVLQEAARVALSAPSGPVSVEIPIAVQEEIGSASCRERACQYG